MPIQVYERFDITPECPGADAMGELWETITWDFLKPTWHTIAPFAVTPAAGWQLNCDFRLPAHGVFRIAHPTDDLKSIELKYDTPSVFLPHYIPGTIRQKNFTPELRMMWEELPNEIKFTVGRMTLTATKDIVDAVESNIMGELYVYRPSELRIA